MHLGAGRVDPDTLLSSWEVTVDAFDFDEPSLDAVAAWAHGHKPIVLWNRSDKHNENEGARRATLAHEICHLLIDRAATLTLSAVVGGAMDRRLEQRANAFAAEFLCPRGEARAIYESSGDMDEVMTSITQQYAVSTQLAVMQLARSGAHFDAPTRQRIEELGPPGASYPWMK